VSRAKLGADQSPKYFAPEGQWPGAQTAMGPCRYCDGTLEQAFLNTKKCLFDKYENTII
jgi:hypothetical protein